MNEGVPSPGQQQMRDEPRRINPTELSQYVRLGQCARFLWLRLHDRTGQRLHRELGVILQSIPPLLTLSGGDFEKRVEAAARAQNPVIHCREGDPPDNRLDNQRVVDAALRLKPGEVLIFLQPRLEAVLSGWHVAGDADLLRLACDEAGLLRVLIVDVKSTFKAKVEHGLQLAFYHAMVERILDEAAIRRGRIDIAVLYRQPAVGGLDPMALTAEEADRQREAAYCLVGTAEGMLEVIAEPGEYLHAVETLVTGPESVARQVAALPVEAVFYHLDRKCGGCLYNQVCMRDSHNRDDLSLIPHLSARDKRLLLEAGVDTVEKLARLKQFQSPTAPGKRKFWHTLIATPGQEGTVRDLAVTHVGPHLDELVHRARRVCKERGRQERSARERRAKAEK